MVLKKIFFWIAYLFRSHMVIAHVEGSPSCPFCDINLTPSQLEVIETLSLSL